MLLLSARARLSGAVPALVAGTIAATVASATSVVVSQTVAPSGGTGANTVAVYRHTASFTPPGTGTLVGTSFPITDTGRTPGVEYFYEAVYTDEASRTANSNEVSATPTAAGDEPLYVNGVSIPWFIGDASRGEYANLTAMGATSPSDVVRLFPKPSPLAASLLGGSSTIDTTRSALITGKGGTGKAAKNICPPSNLVGSPGSYFYVGKSGLTEPTQGSQVCVRFQAYIDGYVDAEFAIKWLHFLLWNVNGGAQPQLSTHNHLPAPVLGSAEATYWQAIVNGFTDGPNGSGNQATQPLGPYLRTLKGSWARFTASYKPHASAGNKNGHLRMWINGVKVVDLSQAAVGVTPDGGEKTFCTQVHVDNMEQYNARWVDSNTLVFVGGAQTATANAPSETTVAYNIGNGDGENLDTFVVWQVPG